MAALCVLMFVANTASPFKTSFLPDALVDFIKLTVLYYLTVSVTRTEQDVETFIRILFVFGSVITLYSLVGYRIGWETPVYRMVSPFGGMGSNSNGFAMLLLSLLPFTMMYMLRQESPIRKLIYIVIALGIVMCIIKTRSRMGFLGLMLQFCIFAWDKRKKAGALLLVVLIIAVAMLRANENLWDRVATISQQTEDFSEYSPARKNKWRQAALLIAQRPITGVGISRFRQAVMHNELGEFEHVVHNAYLEIGVETGIVNMVLFTLLIFGHIRRSFKAYLLFYRQDNTTLHDVNRAIFIASLIFAFCLILLSEQYNSMLYILLGLAAGCDRIAANYHTKPVELS